MINNIAVLRRLALGGRLTRAQTRAVRWALLAMSEKAAVPMTLVSTRWRMDAMSVAARIGVNWTVFADKSRWPEVIIDRVRLYDELRTMGWSYSQIGRAVGRNHNTILCAVGRLRRQRERMVAMNSAGARSPGEAGGGKDKEQGP